MAEKIQMVTPKFRVAFASLFTPKDRNGKEKYEITMLFDESPKELKAKAIEVLTEAFGAEKIEKFKKREKVSIPFKDGNTKDLDNYPFFEDTVVAPASSQFQPGLIDGKRQPILDQEDFYNGCYARAQVSFYTWEFQGKIGVSMNLLNVQKMAEGERLGGGRVKAEDVFDAVESDDDSAENNEGDDW